MRRKDSKPGLLVVSLRTLKAEDRIRQIDQGNPIRDPDYVSRVVHAAKEYKGFSFCSTHFEVRD